MSKGNPNPTYKFPKGNTFGKGNVAARKMGYARAKQLREKITQPMLDEGWDRCMQIIRTGTNRDALAALKFLIEFKCGKTPLAIDVSTSTGGLVNQTRAEFIQNIYVAMKQSGVSEAEGNVIAAQKLLELSESTTNGREETNESGTP